MYKKRLEVDVHRTISKNPIPKVPQNKKAQVTIFIILGILMLLAVALVILVRQEVITFKPEEIIPTEKGKVENFITTCLKDVGEEALFKVGLQAGYIEVPPEIALDNSMHLKISPMHVVPYWAYGTTVNIPPIEDIKVRVDNYIQQNIRSCLFGLEAFQEKYDLIEKSDPLANTEFVESQVIFNLNWDVEIRTKAGDVITEVINHVAESPIKFKHVYEVAKRIVEKEIDSLKLEDLTQDLIALEHPDVPVAGMEISCSKKEWEVKKVEQTILELLRINIRELKVKGTDYVEFPEELTYYQNHYIWDVGEEFNYPDVGVYFNFDRTYAYIFAVTPLSGDKMMSSNLGGSDILSFLCIQTWKFTYDVVYPVLVKVRDEANDYTFNIAFTVHLVKNTPGRNAAVARPSYSLSTQTDEDFCKGMETPMTIFTYELVENEAAGIYDREPLEGVNTSFTCMKYRCEMGQTEYDYGGMGNVAAYTMNFPYCVGGILRGSKPGYKENWIRVVTSPGQQVELDLVPMMSVPAEKVKIVKHEFTSAEKIGPAKELGTTETALVKLTFRKKEDLPGQPYHETNAIKSSELDAQVLENEKLELLAKADYTYEVVVNVLDEDNFVGGYKGNWTVSWEQLQNAQQIVFHVASREDASSDAQFELMLKLDEFSKSIPAPEIR